MTFTLWRFLTIFISKEKLRLLNIEIFSKTNWLNLKSLLEIYITTCTYIKTTDYTLKLLYIYWFILHCISKTTLLYDRGHNDLVVKVIDNHRQPLLFDHVFPGVLHVPCTASWGVFDINSISYILHSMCLTLNNKVYKTLTNTVVFCGNCSFIHS